MGDFKRCALTIVAAMEKEVEEEASSSKQHSISKKRKTASTAANSAASVELCSSNTQHWSPTTTTVSPEASVDSAGTVVSGELCSDRSCCSSSHLNKDLHTSPLDLMTKGFETIEDSTNPNFKSFSLLSEFSGDSDESAVFPAESFAAARKVKTPPQAEIVEFFAMAEKYEQKRFVEKYNFDIVRDLPLEGRYQWVRLH